MFPYRPSNPKPVRNLKKMPAKLIIEQAPSPNFNERTRPIRYVVLHYTGMPSEEKALELLRDPDPKRIAYKAELVEHPREGMAPPGPNLNRVSAHYVAFKSGHIYQLVDEEKRAWQAGAGVYGGETDMNSASIGIEICNAGHDFGLPDFPDEQIDAVMELVKQIKERHGLDKRHIIGHSDLAPRRKIDPGEKFPWHKFDAAGISQGIPAAKADNDKTIIAEEIGSQSEDIAAFQKALSDVGYGIPQNGIFDEDTKYVLIAFQRRYRQSDVGGKLDVDCLEKARRLSKIIKPA